MTNYPTLTQKGYELRERIGEGKFAAVYRAYHAMMGREVAIKIILPEYANQPEFVSSFEYESQLIAQLDHRHIVALYDYWREPDGAFLIMRHMRGGSLRLKLKSEQRLSPEYTARLLDQISAALAVAHGKGIIHKDLKPENILLDDNGDAYLADFGIARTTNPDADMPAEKFIKYANYFPPEVWKKEPITLQRDIYSLGVMLYELLIGESPWGTKKIDELIHKHLNDPLPPLQEKRPDLPIGLNHVLWKATAKNPADRYTDVTSLAADFRAAITNKTNIFISYRRDDSAMATGRLYDLLTLLTNRFNSEEIFIDVDTIAPGDEFDKVIDSKLNKCAVLLAVIGKQWLTVTNYSGRKRLDDPGDFVRWEIATALRRDIRVIPILVEDAAMPTIDHLPDDLASLATRNAFVLRTPTFRRDTEELVKLLNRVLTPSSVASI